MGVIHFGAAGALIKQLKPVMIVSPKKYPKSDRNSPIAWQPIVFQSGKNSPIAWWPIVCQQIIVEWPT